MVYKIADNIVSPLGLTTQENYLAIKSGQTALQLYESIFELPEPIFASLFDYEKMTERLYRHQLYYPHRHNPQFNQKQEYSKFEQLCIYTLLDFKQILNAADKYRTMLILSSTKGNVDSLEENLEAEEYYLSKSAVKISNYFGFKMPPIVVSNACISGVSAQISAYRAIESGKCDHVVIVGGDILSKFIISGFQSFKALSSSPCRPFDKDRSGLNLGEAIGAMLLSKHDTLNGGSRHRLFFYGQKNPWRISATSIHNDANHISGPSRTGEGAYRVITDLMQGYDKEKLAFINAHGTATLYNDEMESIAIHRAGLDDVPVNALKGYYGHTLGAAGVVETILSMAAVDNGTVIGTKGYRECGTSYPLNISPENRPTDKQAFIKILSGFGGSNAGILWEKGGENEGA